MRVIETFVTSVPREKIPAYAKWFMQSINNGVLLISDGEVKPVNIGNIWNFQGAGLRVKCLGEAPLSTDAAETVVTREELMRAYDLVEQGYTLWFGGECPVEKGKLVDVAFRHYGESESEDDGWSYGLGDRGLNYDIIAYRLSQDAVKDDKAVKCDSDTFGESERYNRGAIECIDIIKEMTADKSGLEAFCVGNVVKYLYRYKDKNGIADVIKARNYLNKIIEGSEK